MIKKCSCKKCQACCWFNPGWFGSIEEVKGAAKIMKIPLRKFIKEYLIREWHTDDEDIAVPAPRRNFNRVTKKRREADKIINKALGETIIDREKSRNGKGFVRASWGHNLITGIACIFLDKNNRCLIHKSKPAECRESFGCGKPLKDFRQNLLTYWKKHQDWIRKYVK